MLETLRPELIQGLENVAYLLPLLAMAYTHRQKEWILDLYNRKCQGSNIGMKHKCGGDLQVHHILPQMWAYAKGLPEEQVDSAVNGIPLCADAHVGTRGTKDCLHPDQAMAVTDYTKNSNQFAFGQLQERRQMMMQSGVPYWNTRWQRNLEKLSRATVDKFKRNGGSEFPVHNHRNNGH